MRPGESPSGGVTQAKQPRANPRRLTASAPFSLCSPIHGQYACPLHDAGNRRRRQQHSARQPIRRDWMAGGPTRQGYSLRHQVLGHDADALHDKEWMVSGKCIQISVLSHSVVSCGRFLRQLLEEYLMPGNAHGTLIVGIYDARGRPARSAPVISAARPGGRKAALCEWSASRAACVLRRIPAG